MDYFFKSVLSNPPPEVQPSPTETVIWKNKKHRNTDRLTNTDILKKKKTSLYVFLNSYSSFFIF